MQTSCPQNTCFSFPALLLASSEVFIPLVMENLPTFVSL